MGDTEELQDVGSSSREETRRRAALGRAQAGFVLERAVFLTVRLRAGPLAQRLPDRRSRRTTCITSIAPWPKQRAGGGTRPGGLTMRAKPSYALGNHFRTDSTGD